MRQTTQNIVLALLCLACTGVALYQWQTGASTWLEAFAVLISALTVWLEVIEHIGNWPLGLVGGVAYAIIYYRQNLFANAWLSLFYVPLGIYGWLAWRRGSSQLRDLPITHIPMKMVGILATVTLAGSVIVWKLLLDAKDPSPWLDSVTTVASLVGEFMLARKWIQNWHLWIVVNILSVYLFFSAGLHSTAGLYCVFLAMSFMGLAGWLRMMKSPPTSGREMAVSA